MIKSSLLAAFFLLSHCLLFDKTDDKILKQVASLLAKKDFQNAVLSLQKVSETAKNTTSYLEVAALAYDSVKDYPKAIFAYELLQLSDPSNKGFSDRIQILQLELAKTNAEERVRLEKMKSCENCNGTGFVNSEVICTKCDGHKQIIKDCSRCQGFGSVRCQTCNGAGSITSSSGVTETCRRCFGQGSKACVAMCNRGKVTEDCKKCLASGIVTARKKCTLH